MVPSDSHSGNTTRMVKSKYPLGKDVDTLVICDNAYHAQNIFRAFQLKARYSWGMEPLMSYRFNKIIVFLDLTKPRSSSEEEAWSRYLKEQVETKLSRDGEIVYI